MCVCACWVCVRIFFPLLYHRCNVHRGVSFVQICDVMHCLTGLTTLLLEANSITKHGAVLLGVLNALCVSNSQIHSCVTLVLLMSLPYLSYPIDPYPHSSAVRSLKETYGAAPPGQPAGETSPPAMQLRALKIGHNLIQV